MTTAAAQRPQPRTVYVTTEVEIDPFDLEADGWVYVGKDGVVPPADVNEAIEAVRRWHDDSHPGPFQWCTAEPCNEVRAL